MQAHKLLAWAHKGLDRAMRQCVWNSTEGNRCIHLLNWNTLCKPKAQGGVGLKRAELMNKAMLVKLGWKLVTQDEDVWYKVIRKKYGLSCEGVMDFKPKNRASPIWQGITGSANLLRAGLRWKVANDRELASGGIIGYWTHTSYR